MKIYVLKTLTKMLLKLNVGGNQVRVSLEGGQIKQSGFVGGRYSTNNKDIQKAIESLEIFKKGEIYILKEKKKEVVKEPIKLDPIDSVTSQAQAQELLIDKYEAKSAEVNNKANIIKYAASKGIEFPNLK